MKVPEYFNSSRQKFTTLKQMFLVFHQLPCSMKLRGVPFSQRNKSNVYRFRWLIDYYKGVWSVLIFQHMVVDHFIAVDCEKRLVYDSEYMYPLAL